MSWLRIKGEIYDTAEEIRQRHSDILNYNVPEAYACDAALEFINQTAENADQAEFICMVPDSRFIGMRYCKVRIPVKNRKTEVIENKLEKEIQKLSAYIDSHHCYDRKSRMIGCPECSSSLSVTWMKKKERDSCPLCGTELRSRTVMDKIKAYQAAIRKYKKEMEKIEKTDSSGKSCVKYYCAGRYYVG